jgi:hypothetical protein
MRMGNRNDTNKNQQKKMRENSGEYAFAGRLVHSDEVVNGLNRRPTSGTLILISFWNAGFSSRMSTRRKSQSHLEIPILSIWSDPFLSTA